MGGCCTEKGLALWDVVATSSGCLSGAVKVSREGAASAETGDGEDVLEKACAEGGDAERETGRGEGVFGTERGGVRFFEGGGEEKFKSRS